MALLRHFFPNFAIHVTGLNVEAAAPTGLLPASAATPEPAMGAETRPARSALGNPRTRHPETNATGTGEPDQ